MSAAAPPATAIDRPAWLPPGRWPCEIETLTVDGHRVALTDTGEGPVLLLVHAGTWSFIWRDLIEHLRAGFRVITFDPPATGLSDTGRGAGLGQTARVVDAIVDRLDLRDLTLVVHDLGGPAALQAASRWPDRVAGLVAVNTFGWRPSGWLFRSMLRLMGNPLMRELDVWTGWLPRATSTRFGVGRHLDRRDRKAFRHGMRHRGRRSFHRFMRSAARHDFTAVETAVARLRERPALTIFGRRNDPLRLQPRWRERIPGVEQAVVPKGFHFPMCDAPELVAGLIADWHGRRLRAGGPG
jgi:haloalkane dehalogenase